MAPGNYQWRVKALNDATETPWSVRNLTIDSTLDLSNQTILLNLPTANDTTNSLNKDFSWQPLFNASQYQIEIWSPDLNGSLFKSEYMVNPQINIFKSKSCVSNF